MHVELPNKKKLRVERFVQRAPHSIWLCHTPGDHHAMLHRSDTFYAKKKRSEWPEISNKE